MNRDLEALIQALDALMQAPPGRVHELKEAFDAQVDAFLAREVTLKRESLETILRSYYPKWLRAQKRTSSLPPRA
jgi:hypothetical protein